MPGPSASRSARSEPLASLSPTKRLPWRKHPPPQNLRSATPPDLLRPVHPPALAQSQKMPRPFIRRQPQIIQTKQPHPRRPLLPLQRRLPRQRKIRHPIFHLRPHIRPPLILRLHLHVQRAHPPLRLHPLPRPPIHFPANIKRHLRLYAHLPLRFGVRQRSCRFYGRPATDQLQFRRTSSPVITSSLRYFTSSLCKSVLPHQLSSHPLPPPLLHHPPAVLRFPQMPQ